MSPKGVLCEATNTACACPSALLAIMRACSNATGLRFCGMMLLICTQASMRRRYPNSAVDHNRKSCVALPIFTIVVATAPAVSKM